MPARRVYDRLHLTHKLVGQDRQAIAELLPGAERFFDSSPMGHAARAITASHAVLEAFGAASGGG